MGRWFESNRRLKTYDMEDISKMSTKDKLDHVGFKSDKGKEILDEIGKNATGWLYKSGMVMDGGAQRTHECTINGHVCVKSVQTPGSYYAWGKQTVEFFIKSDYKNKFKDALDMYDHAMTLKKGKEKTT